MKPMNITWTLASGRARRALHVEGQRCREQGQQVMASLAVVRELLHEVQEDLDAGRYTTALTRLARATLRVAALVLAEGRT